MTNKQKQALLAYLGYYVGAIDGIWGSGSREAAKRFRADYGLSSGTSINGTADEKKLLSAVTGEAKPVEKPQSTGDGWDGIRYFKRSEFACKCGGKYCNGYPAEPHLETVRFADEIRARIGKPIKVNSGLRCRQHNANTPGAAANSNHMGGGAADLGCPAGTTPAEMYEIAEEVMGNTGGIILYNWGIHIDDRKVKYRSRG